jgi:hypothetical protein
VPLISPSLVQELHSPIERSNRMSSNVNSAAPDQGELPDPRRSFQEQLEAYKAESRRGGSGRISPLPSAPVNKTAASDEPPFIQINKDALHNFNVGGLVFVGSIVPWMLRNNTTALVGGAAAGLVQVVPHSAFSLITLCSGLPFWPRA